MELSTRRASAVRVGEASETEHRSGGNKYINNKCDHRHACVSLSLSLSLPLPIAVFLFLTICLFLCRDRNLWLDSHHPLVQLHSRNFPPLSLVLHKGNFNQVYSPDSLRIVKDRSALSSS